MKVLFIVGGEGNRYGSEIIAIDLISAGKQHGIEYTVITANTGAVSEVCQQLGVEHYVIPFKFFVYKAMSDPLLDLIKKTVWKTRAEYLTRRAVRRIESAVDMRSMDLIHTNLSRDLLGGMLAERNRIPHVWHIHELFKSHYQLSFLRKDQVPWMAGHADRFIAISRTVAEEWVKAGLPREKVSVVCNGIDFSGICPREADADGKGMKLVMVGHIVPAKGQESVIVGLSLLPKEVRENVTFDCLGEGTEEYKKKLRRIAEAGGVRLSLRGYCSNVGSVLREYDIGINYSRGEGFGLSTVEYMAAGVCPVVADTGANEELIENEQTGFVFDYHDPKAFAELICRLYQNRRLVRETACAARKKAISTYSLPKMDDAVFSIYQEMADKSGRDMT